MVFCMTITSFVDALNFTRPPGVSFAARAADNLQLSGDLPADRREDSLRMFFEIVAV